MLLSLLKSNIESPFKDLLPLQIPQGCNSLIMKKAYIFKIRKRSEQRQVFYRFKLEKINDFQFVTVVFDKILKTRLVKPRNPDKVGIRIIVYLINFRRSQDSLSARFY